VDTIPFGRVHPDYLRGTVFGLEDGLVSTTGAIAGIAAGAKDADTVIMAGLVLVVVEALSMGAGQFLSERSVHQLQPGHSDSLAVGAALMFVAYLVGGMVPLAPVLATGSLGSVWAGTALAFGGLFVLGWVKGRMVAVAPLRSGLEILVIGGAATAVGVVVGVTFGSA
jgi:VIT1/CCC1 family predicted Fe2+/Mn2+ transporter